MELHDLATGPVSPTVAMIFATLGSLLGILLVTQARRRTGARRVRLVVYAALAVALPAVWLPALIAALALRVDGSVLRLTLEPLGSSLGIAIGATLLALLPLCSGRPGPVRQVLAGACLVGAVVGTGAFVAAALSTGSPIVVHPTSIGVAAAIACVTGFGLAGALAASRKLGMATGCAVLLGLALAGVYHVAAAALRVQPGAGDPMPADDVAGVVPQRVGLPGVIAAAVVVALIWYFTLGSATVRDLRLIFDPDSDVEQIEPWMVEQVRTRVALSSTAYAPVPGWPEIWARNEPTVAVHAVQVGRGIADAFTRPLPGRERPALVPDLDGTAPTAEPLADDEPPMDSAEVRWRSVPAWGLPTSLWSQADFEDATSPADEADMRDGAWPMPGRNEPAVARRARPTVVNSRYGPMPSAADRPVSPAPDRAATGLDTGEWVRLSAAASRASNHEEEAGAVIVREYDAAAHPLPRRNARPVTRP
jgi:hypothetical protein